MVRIAGRLTISAPIETVFDTVADSRNEPSFNSDMKSVELLTQEPIGQGTRFRALIGQQRMEMLVEVTEYDRPRRLGSRTTSDLLETAGAITFTPNGEATAMEWDWKVRPKGWLRLLGPLFGLLGRRSERRIWSGLKELLERQRRSDIENAPYD
jgi:uncharacterized membrane protein